MTFGTRKHPQYRKPLPSTSAPQATRTIPPKTLSLKFAQKSGSGVFRTSRACACACAREAMRPFLNNGTTFTTCKPIAPQRPRPSVQSPKPPRIARVKIELGARSRAKPASLLTRPSLARARPELCGFCGSDKKRHARACARGLSAKLYRLRRFPADLSTVSKRRR